MRKRNYGLSPEDWQAKWDKQGGKCAICSNALVKGNATHIDHNHATGKVRDLLCQRCNIRLGLVEDAEWVVALDYLARHEGPKVS